MRSIPALISGLLFVLVAGEAVAHEISFNRSTARSDDYVMLTIVLEDSFIGVDHVKLPLENLTLISGPSTSTEFRWVNGQTSRRRVLSYRLRPNGPGGAAAGPVIVTAPNGDQLTLKRVTLEVVDPVRSDPTAGDELPLGRLPAVVVEVSERQAFVGEQIEVRWSLYGENIRGVQILELPPMDGFWVEQLDVDETTRDVIRVDDELIQRQTLRQVLLYPMRPGSFEIAPLTASVRVYRREPFGEIRGFNPFGGSVSEVTRQSESVTVEVSSPPDPSLPVGSFELACTEPRVPAQGPVAIELALRGSGNLRSIPPPEFSASVPAGVEIEPLPVTMQAQSGSVVMQRRWRYLLFPERAGNLRIPPFGFRFFDPSTEEVRTVTCGGWNIRVSAGAPPVSSEHGSPGVEDTPGEPRSFIAEYWVPSLISVLALLVVAPLLFRRRRQNEKADHLVKLVDEPAELRKALEKWLVRHGHHPSRLKDQAGEIGEAWRSVSSLIDLVDREPWELERSKAELRRRVRDLVEEIR